jgi:hypothetical protein
MTSNFNFRPSPAFKRAVEALKQLSAEERTEAYATAVVDAMHARADERYGPVSGKRAWQRIAQIEVDENHPLPADDHGEVRQGRHLTYTSQPYDLTLGHMREIVRLCDVNDMTVRVDARSWYYPGGTLRMTYWKRRAA